MKADFLTYPKNNCFCTSEELFFVTRTIHYPEKLTLGAANNLIGGLLWQVSKIE
jgi:hypothetical protein